MPILMYDLVGSDKARPFSPHCWKIRMALEHKKLEYETIPVTFTQISSIENGGYKRIPIIKQGNELIEDSYAIAQHIAERYPETYGSLFSGKGGTGISKFVESWSMTQLHPWIAKWALMDIHNMLDPEDQKYFRESREALFKKPLEEVVADREDRIADLTNILTPLRFMLKSQPYIGGQSPLFADYIVFGAFQWLRLCSGLQMIPSDEPVLDWVNRMLDLHDGLARSYTEANA